MSLIKLIKGRFSKGVHQERAAKQAREEGNTVAVVGDEKAGHVSPSTNSVVQEEEWKTAARAMRTASWGTIFYLITTDILGWGSTPYVFANVGWGLGVSMYVLFGAAAALSGWMIWKVFLGLDSLHYPMSSFGDTYFRVYGSFWRHFINVFQALQMFSK